MSFFGIHGVSGEEEKETPTLEGTNREKKTEENQRSGARKGKERRCLTMAAEGSSRGGGGGRKASWLGMSSEGGAAKFLSGLPSRGNFSSISASYTLGRLRVYVCEHDTDPPEGQVIETDTTNILIRHLQLKKKEMDAKEAKEARDAGSRNQGETVKWKRVAPRSLDGQSSSKRPNLGSSSGLSSAEEAAPGFSGHTLQTFTVERWTV
uniref:DET1- and DDB1-associated protein 1 domain-containing protein n=1 Tax=Oryza glumipatula TaxID=40148 RepID=A0A0E0BJ39_9ORYZ